MFRFGIIGAGCIAHKFCDAVSKIDQAQVIGVASKSKERAKDVATKNNIPFYFDSYEELLIRDDIDAVYIATTHNYHYQNIMDCLSHNKHVLCEKCFVLTQADARTVFNFAKEKKLFIMECMWSRYLPGFQKAKEWITEGKIGDIVSCDYSIGFLAEPTHRVYNKTIAGGALYDIGVYGIEGITYLIEEKFTNVQSTVLYSDDGVDLTEHITLAFPSCIATIHSTVCSNISNQAHIYGSKGYIYIPDANNAFECYYYPNNKEMEHYSAPSINGFIYEIEDAIECIKQHKIETPMISHEDTIECARIFDLILGTGKAN